MSQVEQPSWDPAAAERLALDLGDPLAARHVVACYRRILTTRLDRIRDGLEAGDLDAALEATLSLKTASMTVGTRRLVELSQSVERALRAADTPGAAVRLGELYDAAVGAQEALAGYLAT